MKLGQEPAFPTEELKLNVDGSGVSYSRPLPGMSKRFYAACAAMQGLLAHNCDHFKEDDLLEIGIARRAYKLADELLKQE